jgi:flagellar hook-basal body complex protein FliE
MNEIAKTGIQGTPAATLGSTPGKASQGDTASFQKMLETSLGEVNELQDQAAEAIRDMAGGGTQDLHRTMVLMEKADLSFKLMMQVRNKLLDAYQEIMRMPL